MTTAFTSTIARAVLGTVGTAVCAGLCLVAATAPASAAVSGAAAAANGLRTTTVSYADLDVRSAPGRATLDRRIANAARAVCVSADTGPMVRVEEGRCVRQAVSAARSIS